MNYEMFSHVFCVSTLLHLQLFVELNELIVDKDHEMRWKERARWIKFEEDVEEETDRWGKPHVASLSFRSLLELRRTITQGKQLLHACSKVDDLSVSMCSRNKIHKYKHEIQKEAKLIFVDQHQMQTFSTWKRWKPFKQSSMSSQFCSLSIRTFPSTGAILLDLEQNSLPGIAHLVVETMIISDQIRAEDRSSVLRALLLKHRSVTRLKCCILGNSKMIRIKIHRPFYS